MYHVYWRHFGNRVASLSSKCPLGPLRSVCYIFAHDVEEWIYWVTIPNEMQVL